MVRTRDMTRTRGVPRQSAARAGAFALVATLAAPLAAEDIGNGAELSYTEAQAQRGREIYQAHCAICHGGKLNDGQFGTPLKGSYFRSHWRGKSAAELLAFTMAQMPPAQPELLPEQDYADLLALLLQANGVAPGSVAFSRETLKLDGLVFSW